MRLKKELGGLFDPDDFATGVRLARLQPYDPKKIPILCIHGLGDSQATWAPMIESLRADPVIRQNYQVWFFSDASGNPCPASAAILRKRGHHSERSLDQPAPAGHRRGQPHPRSSCGQEAG